MKYGYTTTHLNQNDRLLSGQYPVKVIEVNKKTEKIASKIMPGYDNCVLGRTIYFVHLLS